MRQEGGEEDAEDDRNGIRGTVIVNKADRIQTQNPKNKNEKKF